MRYLRSHIVMFGFIPVGHDQEIVTAGFIFPQFEQLIMARVHWSIRWACRIEWR